MVSRSSLAMKSRSIPRQANLKPRTKLTSGPPTCGLRWGNTGLCKKAESTSVESINLGLHKWYFGWASGSSAYWANSARLRKLYLRVGSFCPPIYTTFHLCCNTCRIASSQTCNMTASTTCFASTRILLRRSRRDRDIFKMLEMRSRDCIR